MRLKRGSYQQQMSFAIINIYYLIEKGYLFKIGKTHKTAAERLKDSDYQRENYTSCYGLFYSPSKYIISVAEAHLIDYLIGNKNCMNRKGGPQSLNDELGDSNEYCVYVAFKKE